MLRDIFRAFPLRAKKATDFELWSDALDKWLAHETGEWDGMADVRDRLMANREFKPEGVRVDPFQMWCWRWSREALRVLKPGGHLLAFGGTRTSHRLVCGLEDAGFEIRDCLVWMYGSGFPKSLDVSKVIDKAAGAERKVIGPRVTGDGHIQNRKAGKNAFGTFAIAQDGIDMETAPATPEAAAWQGWGTALKPAHEPIVLARKPLAGSVAANVLEHGTGALNVDGCRVATDDELSLHGRNKTDNGWDPRMSGAQEPRQTPGQLLGRWPANVILDEEAAALLDEQSGDRPSGSRAEGVRTGLGYHGADGDGGPAITGSSGGASRFFKVVKWTEEDQCHYLSGDAITASAHSSPPSESAASARGGAATSGALEDSGSEAATYSPCPGSTHSRSDSTPTPGPAPDATRLASTATTPTTPNQSASSGSATDAMHGSIVGGDVVSGGVLRASTSGFSRGFYTAKADSAERRGSKHPTIKPLDLMRWLVRLVTPPGGLVLDPFTGSGTTLEAARAEGFRAIGIEREAEYLPDIARRLQQLSLLGGGA